MIIKWIETTENRPWSDKSIVLKKASEDTLVITNEELHNIEGFGGCFNELGWKAIQALPDPMQNQIMDSLFDVDMGAAFSFCRIPMGASDYAIEWYSLNDTKDDFEMEYFSVDRDKECLMLYIKEAIKRNEHISFFASPWSPPVWMKTHKAYNNGRLIMEDRYLSAYSLYFKKFIEAYNTEGIPIKQIHIQNEPFADQKFPSCLWSAEQFRLFIGDYIGPKFKEWNIDTQIWLGTLNGPTQMELKQDGVKLDLYDKYIDHILFDDKVRQYLSGIGYQWAGQHVVRRTHESFPELGIIQTENECGDGKNTYLYAQYVFNLILHYLKSGANAYVYWNMVLEDGGVSTWGWHQNALISVDSKNKRYQINHEFFVMKHFSKVILPGAKLLKTKGHFSGASLAALNPDGSIGIVVSNALDRKRDITLHVLGKEISLELEENSFNSFLV